MAGTVEVPDFAAPGARLGHWWFPADSDAEQFSLGGLPDRRQQGILASSDTGHWALQVSRMPLLEDNPAAVWQFAGLERTDTIWGKAQKGCVSLFDGMRIGPAFSIEADPQETWIGSWWAESPTAWIHPDDRADKVEVEFDVGTAWAESPRHHPPWLDLQDSWRPDSRTFTVPDPLVHEARIDGARLQLRSECVPNPSRSRFTLTMRTYFSIENDVPFRDIRTTWARPLFEFLSFFWLRSAKVLRVRARLRQTQRWFDLHYPNPLARSSRKHADDPARGPAPFCALGDLQTRGYDFATLLQRYFEWRQAGYAPAVAFLVDSQEPLLDHSVEARLLRAINSLEAFEKARTNTKRIKLHRAVDQLIQSTGPVGAEIEDVWCEQSQPRFGKSLARTRATRAAHSTPGGEDHFPPEPALLDQEWHLTALQWLLRCRYLQSMGLSPAEAADLVTEAIDYQKGDAIQRPYQ